MRRGLNVYLLSEGLLAGSVKRQWEKYVGRRFACVAGLSQLPAAFVSSLIPSMCFFEVPLTTLLDACEKRKLMGLAGLCGLN